MRCRCCGADNRDGARFCSVCGKPMDRNGDRDEVRARLHPIALILIGCVVALAVCFVVLKGRGGGGVNSVPEVDATLEAMRVANGGELPEIYFDSDGGTPRFVNGCFTSRVVRSEDDALAALGDIGSLYGLDNPEREFSVAKVEELEDGTTYRLQQYFQGVEVFGNQLVVTCDQAGKTTSLSGSYLQGIDVEVPKMAGLGEGYSVAIWQGGDGPQAVLKHEGAAGVTLYSLDGREMIYSQPSVEEKNFVDVSIDGENLTFTAEEVGNDRYSLYDSGRNLVVFDANGSELTAGRCTKDGKVQCGTYGRNKFIWYGDSIKRRTKFSGSELVESPDGTYEFTRDGVTVEGLAYESLFEDANDDVIWLGDSIAAVSDAMVQSVSDWSGWHDDAMGVKALSYVTKVYDFYLSNCDWRGYDGKGGLFRIVVNNQMGKEDNAWSIKNLITFSEKSGVDATTAAHEYTHSVMGEASGELLNLPETASLKEAYADIMAAIIMEPRTWDLGGRNLTDPSLSTFDEDKQKDGKCQHPTFYKGEYWYDIGTDDPTFDNDYGGSHQNSTVISHAAYLMHAKGISDTDLGRIWFRSMFFLDPHSDFYSCRYAVLAAAKALGYGSDVAEVIEEAFAAVGLARYDVSTMRVAPNAKIFVEDSEGNRIQGFEIQLRYAGSEFGDYRGEVACSASTTTGYVNMAEDFGGEPLVGRYFFDVYSENAAQEIGPMISVTVDGSDEIVITLPILVAHLDSRDDKLDSVAVYAAYASKLEEYLGKYGGPRVVTGGSTWAVSGEGVCLAELVDFDGDGLEELYVAYYDADNESTEYDWSSSGHDANAYVVEVWSFVDGELRMAYQSQASTTQQGLAYCSRSIPDGTSANSDGLTASWIYYGGNAEGHYTSSLWSLSNGAASIEHKWEVIGEFTPDAKELLDGEETDLSEGEWLDTFAAEWKDYWLMDFAQDEHVSECVDLTKETLHRLGITIEDNSPTMPVSIDDSFSQIEDKSGKPVVRQESMDYDGDGADETFVIVGSAVDGVYETGDAWNDAELWFVSSSGDVSKLAGEETFPEALMYMDVFGDDARHTFLSLENTAFGSEGTAHVFTVWNGRPIEVGFDLDHVDWVRGEGGGIVGTVHLFEGTHTRQDHWFEYDESTNMFYDSGARGDQY